MDSFVLKKVVEELKEKLPGALVSKAFQFGKKEIYFDLWKPGESFKLVISAHPVLTSFHTTTRSFKNPPSPPRFTQALRKHLAGTRISHIELLEFERSLTLFFREKEDERPSKKLVSELFGRHGNIILLDGDDRIINALNIVTRETSSVREVVSGGSYAPLPPPSKQFLPRADLETCRRVVLENWRGIEEGIFRNIHGVSKEVISQLSLSATMSEEDILVELQKLVLRYRNGEYGVATLMRKGKPWKLLPLIDEKRVMGEVQLHESADRGADEHFYSRYYLEKLEGRKQSLSATIKKKLKKEQRKKERMEIDLEKLRDMEKYGKQGELLKQGLHESSRGQKEFRAIDYSASPPEEVVIDLDPSLTPLMNMKRFFRLYKKGQKGIRLKEKMLPAIDEECAYLGSLQFYIDGVKELEDLPTIEEEMIASGILRKGKGKKGKKRKEKYRGRGISQQVDKKTIQGYTLYVGKNNRGNDHLLRTMAKPEDLWLHARYHPGSHILIKKGGPGPIPEEVIYQAGLEAARRSRGSSEGKVEIYVAHAKDVRKIPGQRPGMVRIAKYKTIVVSTEES